MDPHVSIVTLGVSDLERSIAFYRDGLSLPLRERDPDDDIAFFTLSGTWLALYPWDALAEDATVSPTGDGFSGVTIAHNTDSRDEVDAVLAEAEAAGATIEKPAQDVFWGGYSGYFADPDGHLWEVAWDPHSATQAAETADD
ncbi:VOC family protein [Natronobiforma cellulositropha]|uniref:VOC family protein n=1 Tax=Natronobiforma cellulositropha TaxID=1679076 RepID=UPI0021D59E42|nr:VOC family protein [Natronobiforma cellulositropha]